MTTDRGPRFPPRGDGHPSAEGGAASEVDRERTNDWLTEQHRLLDLEDGRRS